MDFSWESMKKKLEEVQGNVFDNKGGFNNEVDERFFRLTKNKDGAGGAIIRFIPDPDGIPFIHMIKRKAENGYNKRFVEIWSPLTIGKKDPINERFTQLWKAGKKEEAKNKYKKYDRYFANILVIKDPGNPDNEGKVFLLDMSQTLFDKVKEAINPSDSERELGVQPKNVFDPLNGYNFLLKVKKGSNKIYTYEDSKFQETPSAIAKDEKEAQKIINQGYKLSEFLDPSFYLTEEEILEKLAWYDGVDTQSQNTQTEQPKKQEQTAQTTQTTQNDDAPFDVDDVTENTNIENDNSDGVAEDDLDALMAELD